MVGYVNKNKIVDIFDGSLHSNSSPTHSESTQGHM